MTAVVARALRDMVRGLVGWSIGMVALVVSMALVWPSMHDMADLDAFLASYPEPMRELFNLEAFGTGAGFLNAELFSFMLPAMFLIFAISRGARMIAGEEEEGVLEVLWALPQPRWRILSGKAAALAAAVAVLAIVLFASIAGAGAAVGMDVPLGEVAGSSASMAVLGVEFGWLALAIGAAIGRRAMAAGGASVAAAAAYVVYALSLLVDALDGWAVISPVQHALRDGPLGTGWAPGHLLVMGLAGLGALLAATPILTRRDIRA